MPGKQGFASMDPEKRKAISSLGGQKAQALGVAHRWTKETARAAGRKGGQISKRGPAKRDSA